jgi:hypothetical protein
MSSQAEARNRLAIDPTLYVNDLKPGWGIYWVSSRSVLRKMTQKWFLANQ